MRRKLFRAALALLALVVAGVLLRGLFSPLRVSLRQTPEISAGPLAGAVSPGAPAKKRALPPVSEASLRSIPLPFIANNGQVDKRVKFYARTFGGTLFITAGGELVYALPWALPWREVRESGARRGTGTPSEAGVLALRESLVGAALKEIRGEGETVAKVSSFKGSDPSGWRTGIPSYASVTLGEIYEGIELQVRAKGSTVEKIFRLRPGADPRAIAVRIQGSSSLALNGAGELEAETEKGKVTFTRPVAYQDTEGGRRRVEVAYAVSGDTYRFAVGDYDRTKELVIDPLLASTFLGGGGSGYVKALQLDPTGNVYLTGYTLSADFPIAEKGAGVLRSQSPSYDAFVVKMSGDLTALLAAALLGGSRDDQANALVVDASGGVYVAGYTTSPDYPATGGSYDPTPNNRRRAAATSDAFITKLDGDLSTLLFSTFLGGSSDESITALALDASGNLFAAGHTRSDDFPVTKGAYSTTFAGDQDAFVVKLDNGLASLLASTFLGGGQNEYGRALALDSSEMLYLTGNTFSDDFPVTEGAYSTAGAGNSDVFIARFDGDLTTLSASTLLGGERDDIGYALALTASGEVLVTGTTGSSDFPVTEGAYSTTFAGDQDAFVVKLDSGLTTLLASTFLGGSGETRGYALVPDPSGGVYIAGSTTSDDFPATEGAFDTIFSGSSDAFVAKLDSNLTALPAATLLGGSSGEDGRALALDTSGDVYVAGETSSRNYPTTKEAFAASLQGTNDIFVSRLDSLLSGDSTPPESCIYRLVVQKGAISGSGGTGEISVTASSDRCSWTAESAEDWITLTEGAEGTGDGTISFSIEANPDPTPRRGTLTVAGRTVTVTQKAAIPHLSAPSLVSFGTVTVGESAAKEVTVRNTGTGVLEISRVSVLGKGFELEENTCETGAVAPDSACTVTLRFSPSSTGSFRGRLSLESNDPDHPITGVLLTGKGKQSSE